VQAPGQPTSNISILGPEGSINNTLTSSPLRIPDDAHDLFQAFNRNLTDSQVLDFSLVGQADAASTLSIGNTTLNPIKFNVQSHLNGLNGLRGSTTINSVDVTGGTSDHISLNIAVSITNPSSINLNTSDLTLQLS
jgi:hypothetical protein